MELQMQVFILLSFPPFTRVHFPTALHFRGWGLVSTAFGGDVVCWFGVKCFKGWVVEVLHYDFITIVSCLGEGLLLKEWNKYNFFK